MTDINIRIKIMFWMHDAWVNNVKPSTGLDRTMSGEPAGQRNAQQGRRHLQMYSGNHQWFLWNFPTIHHHQSRKVPLFTTAPDQHTRVAPTSWNTACKEFLMSVAFVLAWMSITGVVFPWSRPIAQLTARAAGVGGAGRFMVWMRLSDGGRARIWDV